MDPFTSIVHAGGRQSVLVQTVGHDNTWVYGVEFPFSDKVAFRNVGMLDEYVTLYDIIVSNQLVKNGQILEMDDPPSLIGGRTPNSKDVGFAHDVRCGMGGSTAFVELGGKIISAVDSADLATSSYQLNHCTTVVTADIGSSKAIRAMHEAQREHNCQPLCCAGFPCQPLSRQGLRKGAADPRSGTLLSILTAARLLHVCALALEWVPESGQDRHVQDVLQRFAELDGFNMTQSLLHLNP